MSDIIESLIADLENPDRVVRHEAVIALRKHGDASRSAIPALKRIMADTSEPYLQIFAAGAIGKLDPTDPTTIPVLVAALDDPNPLHRAAACEFLGQRRHSAALRTMKLFNDPCFAVRFAAAKAYSRFTGNWLHAVAMAVEMLKSANATDRAMGAEALMTIKRAAREHLDLLTMALADASWESRLDIEEVMAQLRTA